MIDPAVLVPSAFFAGVALILVVEIMRWIEHQPHDVLEVQGVTFRVRWLEGAVRDWPGLRETLDAVITILRTDYPMDYARILSRVWLEIVPTDGAVIGEIPPGAEHQASGTTRGESYFVGLLVRHVIPARQLRASVRGLDGKPAMTGALLPAIRSAIVHELLEHETPLRLSAGKNAEHAAKWRQLTDRAVALYRTKGGPWA